jgi:hypothetical protein
MTRRQVAQPQDFDPDAGEPHQDDEDELSPALKAEVDLVIASMPQVRPEPLNEFTALQAVMKDDIQYFNLMMAGLAGAWQFVNPLNVDEVCKLSETTAKMLKARRQALLLPTEKNRGKMFTVEDDFDEGN